MPTLPSEVMMKAVEVELAVEVEMARRGMFESEDVAEMERRAHGVVELIPSEAGVVFQKRFALSWVRSPPEPMNGTDPCVRDVVKEEVATKVPNCPTPPWIEAPETMFVMRVGMVEVDPEVR